MAQQNSAAVALARCHFDARPHQLDLLALRVPAESRGVRPARRIRAKYTTLLARKVTQASFGMPPKKKKALIQKAIVENLPPLLKKPTAVIQRGDKFEITCAQL